MVVEKDQSRRRDELNYKLCMRLDVKGIVDQSCYKKQCARSNDRVGAGEAWGEHNEPQNKCSIDCGSSQQRSWLAMPPVLPRSRHKSNSQCQCPSDDNKQQRESKRETGG